MSRIVTVKWVGAANPSLGSMATIFGYHSARTGANVFRVQSANSGAAVVSRSIVAFPSAVVTENALPASGRESIAETGIENAGLNHPNASTAVIPTTVLTKRTVACRIAWIDFIL